MTEQVESSEGLLTLAQKQEVDTVVSTGFIPDSTDTSEEQASATQDAVDNTSTKYQGVDYKKRYDDLKRHYDDVVNQHKVEVGDLRQQITEARPSYTPPKTVEELENFRRENPDLYGVVESVAHLQADSQLKTMKQEISELNKERRQALKETEYAKLKQRHPDIEEIKQDAAFHQWASVQAPEIRSWLFEKADSGLAARAIDLFKADHNRSVAAQQTTESVKQGMASAANGVSTKQNVDPLAGQPKVWTEAEIKAMSLKEFETHKDEIDKAFAEGRIKR